MRIKNKGKRVYTKDKEMPALLILLCIILFSEIWFLVTLAKNIEDNDDILNKFPKSVTGRLISSKKIKENKVGRWGRDYSEYTEHYVFQYNVEDATYTHTVDVVYTDGDNGLEYDKRFNNEEVPMRVSPDNPEKAILEIDYDNTPNYLMLLVVGMFGILSVAFSIMIIVGYFRE